MARKVDKTPKLCVICGDRAKGINFNALTCMSCKAFFRRNALRNKEMKCPFNDSCQVDKITRKFCSKCRLKKCFDLGMKKEWILSDEEKRLIKEKIMRNRIRRQQQEMEIQQQQQQQQQQTKRRSTSTTTTTSTTMTIDGQHQHQQQQQQQHVKLTSNGKISTNRNRRQMGKNLSNGESARQSYRKQTLLNDPFETGSYNNSSSSASSSPSSTINGSISSITSSSSHLFNALGAATANHQTNYGTNLPLTKYQSINGTSSSSSSNNQSINAYNIFQEPSAYSLDILLSDNCDALFDSSGASNNSFTSSSTNSSPLDDLLFDTIGQSSIDPIGKRDDLSWNSSRYDQLDQSLSINSAMADCCNLLFPNSINSIEFFTNDTDIETLEFSPSPNSTNTTRQDHDLDRVHCRSPLYENGVGGGMLQSNLSNQIGIKRMATTTTTITPNSATSNNNTNSFEYNHSQSNNSNGQKMENDFTQYLLHDNDPTWLNGTLPQMTQSNPHHHHQHQHQHHHHQQPTPQSMLNSNTNWTNQSTTNQHQITSETLSHHPPPPLPPPPPPIPQHQNRYLNQNEMNNKQSIHTKVLSSINHQTSSMINDINNDFISNCLISSNDDDHSVETCNDYDPVIELVPRIGSNDSPLREIGFSNRELIPPERCLIKELTDACVVLKNPYKRIMVFNNYDSVRSCRITEYSFHRLIRMSKRLSRFSQLPLSDQAKMLKFSLLEMLAIRSVLDYNPDRESWAFIDDKCKVNVMVRMDVIRPFCTKCGFQRHKNFPNLFRHEWKNDNIIFDLLTAIVLFTPRPGVCQHERIKEEQLRYVYLLRRYLEIKYPTIVEAKESFSLLMNHLDEMRQLNADIFFFFRSYSTLLQTSPLFNQLLDLDSVAYCRNNDGIFSDENMFETANNVRIDSTTSSRTTTTTTSSSVASNLQPEFPIYSNGQQQQEQTTPNQTSTIAQSGPNTTMDETQTFGMTMANGSQCILNSAN